ncbi:LPXTG cell wall anchor domain-containing protein [Lacticaseibacillus paracasei]|nr:LPXTG cell wall anchor domain-containing protein [Lacticaseibacillus paracasei]
MTAIGAKAFNANLIPEVAIAGTPTIDQEAFSNNRITVLHAATAVPTTPDALNQNADAYTDSAHVSLRDLFSVAISGVSQDQIVVSNIQGTGVAFNTATKSFTMPAGTEQFSFNWSLKAADGTTYTGLYKVHLNDPVIHAHDINLFTGQVWKPELNFGGAVKKNGTEIIEIPLSDLTWTVTDQNGAVIASKDRDGVVTGSVPSDQVTWYTVTYAYGAESGSAKIFYNQRLAASYSLTGTQTATATGQPITVDLTAFSLSLGDGFNAGALQLSDLNFFDASDNQIAADALTKTGVYRVELSKAAWARIAELTNDAGESAANYNFTGTSTAQLIIGLTAIGQLNNSGFTYDGTTLASQAPKLVLNVTLSDGSQQAIDLTSTDISLVEADSPDVGTYRYLLNGSGLTRIQAILGDEVTIDQTDINTHPGVITITPATATATVNGTQFVYDGKTTASQTSGLQLTLTAGSGTTVVDLSSTDIVVGSDSVNVGDYQYQLSQSGVAKVEQALNANYQLPSDLLGSLTGTITIAPAQGTAELRDDSFIYDGQTKASQAQGLTGDVTIGNVTVPVILTSADIAVGNDGVNVGNYQYSLTNTGIAKLQQSAGSNYQLNASELAKLTGTITITPAEGAVNLSDTSFVYDGKTKASQAQGLTANVTVGNETVPVTLTSADIAVANDGVNVGNYQYSLTNTGIAKLQQAVGNNYQLNASELAKLAGTITITPAEGAVNLSDTSFVYDGKTKAGQAQGLTANVTVGSATVPVPLTSVDFVVGNDGVNVGNYQYSLTNTGIAKLQQAVGSNYQLNASELAKLIGTITITPAASTATLTNTSFVYDGKTKAGQAQGLTANVTVGNETVPVTLKPADFVVANDGVNVGSYQYTLTATGIAKLQQAAGSNYQLNASELAKLIGTITITPAEGAVNLSDTSFVYDGKTKAGQAQGLTANVTVGSATVPVILAPADFVVGNDGVNVGSYRYTLTATGIAKLQQAVGSNYLLTVSELAKLTGNINITPATTTADLNDGSFMYDGQTKASQAQGLTAVVKLGDDTTSIKLDASDIVVADDGVNVGSYHYRLSTDAITKLQQVAGPNYQLKADDLAALMGIITITPAEGTATVNDTTFVYDGRTKASEASGLNGVVYLSRGTARLTVALTTQDIVVDGDNTTTGTYHYHLSHSGIAKLKAAAGTNYALNETDLNALTGTITITPLTVVATVNNGHFQYDGVTRASQASGLLVTVQLPTGAQTVALTNADIDVANDSVNVGTYTYRLSASGIAKVMVALGPNYQINDTTMNGTITITPAVLSGQLSGMQQKIYDGQPGELNAQHFELIFTDGSHIILEDSDLAFADGIAPIVVGRYAVTLSAGGLKRIQALLPNYLLENVDTQQAVFEIVAKLGPLPDTGTGTDTGTSTGHETGKVLSVTGRPSQSINQQTPVKTTHQLPQTGDTSTNDLSIVGLILTSIASLFGLAGVRNKKRSE